MRAVDREDAVLRRYLGDGVYAVFDGVGIWLTAENGLAATDAIYLEPEVFRALEYFKLSADAGEQSSGRHGDKAL